MTNAKKLTLTNTQRKASIAIKDARATAKGIRENAASIRAVFREMNKLLGAHCDMHDSVYVYSWGNVEVNVYASLDCDSMNTGVVPKLCEALLDAGCTADRTTDWVNEHAASRDFRFLRTDGNVSIRVILTANLKGDGPTCKKVQVGEEVTRRPKYEIQCN